VINTKCSYEARDNNCRGHEERMFDVETATVGNEGASDGMKGLSELIGSSGH
jgi:hypothetical protein